MDPITFFLIVGAALWVTDTASGGLVRAELGGGVTGAARGAGRRWVDRRVRTHRRRQKARAKTRAGRTLNYLQDEAKAYVAGVREGWPEGRARAHAKRRERWERKPPWWRRWFGQSETPNDGPNGGPNGDPNEPEGPDGPERPDERNPWGDPEPIRTTGSGQPERFRLDVHVGGSVSSGGFASKLPKDDAIEAAKDWAEGIMAPLNRQSYGLLYRITGGAEELVSKINGEERWSDDPAPSDATKGTSTMPDITTAPAAIAAWEAIKDRFEEIRSLLDALHDDASSTEDQMGDFAVGSEGDAVNAIGTARDETISAEESVDTVLADLHEEWDEHIAASEGRTAGAHAPFQEV